jgi:hypothetical protein
LKEHFGLRGRQKPSARPFEQFETGFAFELRNQVGNSGLGNAELVCGGGHGAGFDDGVKGLQLAESEGHGQSIN